MKMLFFSSDRSEVQELSREFTREGIPCEIRSPRVSQCSASEDAELWIHNDQDCHRALMLCVQRNMGFARRPIIEDIESLPAYC